jgi:hypothetical protein
LFVIKPSVKYMVMTSDLWEPYSNMQYWEMLKLTTLYRKRVLTWCYFCNISTRAVFTLQLVVDTQGYWKHFRFRLFPNQLAVLSWYTGLFISPSGFSELCSTITKTDTAERSISTDRETLQVCNASSWRTCGFYR